MDFNLINQSMLGVFFMYLVMFGSDINKLLNCGLRKHLQNNVFLIHIIVFVSIFVFTFVLNWYTPSSLVLTETFQTPDLSPNKYSYITNSIWYSVLIYVIFLCSTRQEHAFMFSFIILMIITIGIFIIFKIESDTMEIDDKLFKNLHYTNRATLTEKIGNDKSDIYGNNLDNLVNVHNVLVTFYYIILANLLVGVGLYYRRQSIEHRHNWSLLKFIFGKHTCDKLR